MMAAPRIAAVATATPRWRYDQATVLRMSGYDDPRRMGFFSNSLIETRHLYMDPETFTFPGTAEFDVARHQDEADLVARRFVRYLNNFVFVPRETAPAFVAKAEAFLAREKELAATARPA